MCATPLPPGPAAGRLAQAVGFHRDPLAFLAAARERYGDVFTLRLAVAGPTVVVADHGAVAAIVASDPVAGHAGEARRRILGMVSPQSVLGADGVQHHAARGRVAAAFTPEVLAARRTEMAAIAEEHVERWPRGRPLRLLPRVRAITDDVFARLVLGVRDEERARGVAAAIGRMLWTPGNPPLPIPGPQDGLLGAVGAGLFPSRSAPLERLLAAEIAERRARPGGAEGDDVIACMLRADPAMPAAEMVDELVPLTMAGQEPPASALTWLLDRLARSPGVAGAVAGGAPVPDGFVRETLRVRPPVHSVARRLTASLEAGGHVLPAGAVAAVSTVLLHHDRRAFAEPDAFRPERWLAGEADTSRYLPFGGGARRCLGEPLAHAEIAAVLPAIVRRVVLRPLLPRPERMVVRGTVLVPQRSGLAIARAR